VAKHWLLTADALVQFQGSLYGICGGQGGTRVSFFSNAYDYSTYAPYSCNISDWYSGLFEVAVRRDLNLAPSPTQHKKKHTHTHTPNLVLI
jgi:hypothetical protein